MNGEGVEDEVANDASATVASHSTGQLGVVDESKHTLGEVDGGRLGQKSRLLRYDRLLRSAGIDGDHRPTRVHRFDRNDAEVLVRRRVDDGRRRFDQRAFDFVVGRLDERDRSRVEVEVQIGQLAQLLVVLDVLLYATVVTARDYQMALGEYVCRYFCAQFVCKRNKC